MLGNAAHALAGMVGNPIPAAADRPAVGLTMFGVTTPCVTAVTERLGDDVDPLVFHATGTGGRAMEKLVDDGLIGPCSTSPRPRSATCWSAGCSPPARTGWTRSPAPGCPMSARCGALDMVNFGAPATVPEPFAGRLFYEHNPQVTLMRTTVAENVEIGRFLAGKLNACPGPVRVPAAHRAASPRWTRPGRPSTTPRRTPRCSRR